jgi:hypothetical protein
MKLLSFDYVGRQGRRFMRLHKALTSRPANASSSLQCCRCLNQHGFDIRVSGPEVLLKLEKQFWIIQ